MTRTEILHEIKDIAELEALVKWVDDNNKGYQRSIRLRKKIVRRLNAIIDAMLKYVPGDRVKKS